MIYVYVWFCDITGIVWGITQQICIWYYLVTIGNCFPSVWEILPSTFSVGQYFPNFGETISNSDLNASHYLYDVICFYWGQSICWRQRQAYSILGIINRNFDHFEKETFVLLYKSVNGRVWTLIVSFIEGLEKGQKRATIMALPQVCALPPTKKLINTILAVSILWCGQ